MYGFLFGFVYFWIWLKVAFVFTFWFPFQNKIDLTSSPNNFLSAINTNCIAFGDKGLLTHEVLKQSNIFSAFFQFYIGMFPSIVTKKNTYQRIFFPLC